MKRTTLTGSSLRLRKNFCRVPATFDIPNLIGLQKKSYEDFLQKDIPSEKRKDIGLQAIFKSIFPISDYNNKASLEFVKYRLFHPKYDVIECRQRGMTYASTLKVTLRLVVFEESEEEEKKVIRDIKEQEVYLSDLPLMTDSASFIINGTERVVVSQLHRSPGVFFDHDGGKGSASGKYIYFGRVIPYRGSWLDFEFDQKDLVNVRIDRKRKFPATIILKAIGYSTDDILSSFYAIDKIQLFQNKIIRHIDIEQMEGQRVLSDIKNSKGALLVRVGRRITRSVIKKVKAANVKTVEIDQSNIKNLVTGKPIIDKTTGEVLLESNQDITSATLDSLKNQGITELYGIFFDSFMVGPYISNTLKIDKVASREEALVDIFKRMKPGEPPHPEVAEKYLENLFFNESAYDLGQVGRVKINRRFQITDIPDDFGVLTKRDILTVVRHLVKLKSGQSEVDDIDHLGNRRVRSVGELLENQYRIGLVRMERVVRERMNLQDEETMMPHDLINAKSVSAVVKEFLDPVNCLSSWIRQILWLK